MLDAILELAIQAAPVQRQVDITATVFTFEEHRERRGAYGDYLKPHNVYVALPAEVPRGTLVYVYGPHGRVLAQVLDKGPWNAARKHPSSRDDPYWRMGCRPQAELGLDYTGRKTNGAGIDLSPGLAKKLGINGKGRVDWELIQIAPPFLA